jgi:hypothetical protein
MGELKYLSGGQNKNKNLFWNQILFWNGPKYIDFFKFCLLWSTILTSEYDVEEGGIKILIFFMKMAIFLGWRLEKR